MDAVVVSPGGTATTALIRYLAKHVRTNCPEDKDGLKHSPVPLRVAKTIFLRDTTRRSGQSLLRRRYLRSNALKLGGSLWCLLAPRKQLLSIWEILLDCQERRFTALPPDECLVIGIKDLRDSAEAIASFLEIEDPKFVSNFPITAALGSGGTRSVPTE
jgi:hypothetical protein